MFQQILVPLDGSTRAEQALPVAARLARAASAKVTLLRVVSPSPEWIAYSTADARLWQTIIDADLAEARAYLAHLTELPCFAGVGTIMDVAIGQSAAKILSVVETRPIDLIVLCSHGYTGVKRWALGSVAEKVAQHASIPVLVLREGGYVPLEGPVRALIPLDGSVYAKAALVPAARLIAALSAPEPGVFHLTRIVALPEEAQLNPGERDALLYKARLYLRSTAEQLREGLVARPVADLQVTISWSVTIDEDIASGVLWAAEGSQQREAPGMMERSHLIAMASHGYSGVQRWAMGSITGRVLHASRLPLLIVRSPNVREASADARKEREEDSFRSMPLRIDKNK